MDQFYGWLHEMLTFSFFFNIYATLGLIIGLRSVDRMAKRYCHYIVQGTMDMLWVAKTQGSPEALALAALSTVISLLLIFALLAAPVAAFVYAVFCFWKP